MDSLSLQRRTGFFTPRLRALPARLTRGPWRLLTTRAVSSLLLLTAVAACDSVPDAVNPLAEKKAAQPGETLDTSAVPGAEKPYPNLADVPDRPSYRLTKEQRESLIEGLVADREHARHTGAPTLQSSAEPAQGMLMSTQPRGKRT